MLKTCTSTKILGPITYSTYIDKSNKKSVINYIYTCVIQHSSINLSFELKCILHKYLIIHIAQYHKSSNTSFHISSIANILIVYSTNISNILEILKSVKYVLNCTKCISETVPKKYMHILNSNKPIY